MSNTKFKPGDRFRVVRDEDERHEPGTEGTIVMIYDNGRPYPLGTSLGVFRESEIEKIEDNDPVSPNHYRFPGGAEVIQISEHLTSNGGQAVQYIARATRLDGQIKGNAIEDLEKSLFFIQREIDRLKESK